MKYFDQKDLASLDHLYRINLINSSSGFKSANLIATINKEGISNVAVFSSVIHLGSNPPLLGFLTRLFLNLKQDYLIKDQKKEV